MSKPRILIALGSPSPSDRGLLSQLSLDDSVEYQLSIASEHRTPETVEKHFNGNNWIWDAIIPGAGMTNALLSAYVKRAHPSTLVIGLPINDKVTNGISSMLSSQELPPGYVAACTGLDQLGKAAKLAARLVTTEYKSIVIYDFVADMRGELSKKAAELLERFKIPYRVETLGREKYAPKNGELQLAVLSEACDAKIIDTQDPIIATTHGHLVLGSLGPSAGMASVRENPNLLVVGYVNPTNLALFGAKVMSRSNPDLDLPAAITKYWQEGAKKYDPYKELIKLDSPEKIKQIVEAK